RFAVQSLLDSDEPVGRLRGRVHTWRGVPLVVTYHPAYLLRSPAEKARAWADLCLAARAAEGSYPTPRHGLSTRLPGAPPAACPPSPGGAAGGRPPRAPEGAGGSPARRATPKTRGGGLGPGGGTAPVLPAGPAAIIVRFQPDTTRNVQPAEAPALSLAAAPQG